MRLEEAGRSHDRTGGLILPRHLLLSFLIGFFLDLKLPTASLRRRPAQFTREPQLLYVFHACLLDIAVELERRMVVILDPLRKAEVDAAVGIGSIFLASGSEMNSR